MSSPVLAAITLSAYPSLVLLPPVVAILAAILARNIFVALTLGLLSGAWLAVPHPPVQCVGYLAKALTTQVVCNLEHLYILGFLWCIGMLVYLMQHNGHMEAFGQWVARKVTTPSQGQRFTLFLSSLLFIDDYFNTLAVGSVTRTLSDRLGISRAKLAYLLDATSAPLCILMPFSSWGATIIGTLGGLIVAYDLPYTNGLSLFAHALPFNGYAWLALLLAGIVASRNTDFGAMHLQECVARQRRSAPSTATTPVQGRLPAFLLPLLILVFATIGLMFWTGYMHSPLGQRDVLRCLINTQLEIALLGGGACSTLAAWLVRASNNTLRLMNVAHEGWRLMRGCMLTLVLAWMFTHSLRNDLQAGAYFSSLLKQQTVLSINFLPFLIFTISALIAAATGTSWGTFLLMLPIAIQVASSGGHVALAAPMVGAVLSGAAFGDHCSPISDTTILASTAAGCDHLLHVTTQLPYCLFVAGTVGLGYAVYGATNTWLAAAFATLGCFVLGLRVLYSKRQR